MIELYLRLRVLVWLVDVAAWLDDARDDCTRRPLGLGLGTTGVIQNAAELAWRDEDHTELDELRTCRVSLLLAAFSGWLVSNTSREGAKNAASSSLLIPLCSLMLVLSRSRDSLVAEITSAVTLFFLLLIVISTI